MGFWGAKNCEVSTYIFEKLIFNLNRFSKHFQHLSSIYKHPKFSSRIFFVGILEKFLLIESIIDDSLPHMAAVLFGSFYKQFRSSCNIELDRIFVLRN